MMQAQDKTPAGVVFYDRLRSNGEAYFNMGITAEWGQNYSFSCKWPSYGSEAHLFGGYATGSMGYFNFGFSARGSAARVGCGRLFSLDKDYSSVVSAGGIFNVDITYVSNGRPVVVIEVDGVSDTFNPTSSSTTPIYSHELYLFATRNASGGLYSISMNGTEVGNFKVRNAAGSMIRDFRPCTYNGEAGMWDMVENKFYGNIAAKGVFSVVNN